MGGTLQAACTNGSEWWPLLLPWLPVVVVTLGLGVPTLMISAAQRRIAAEQKEIAAQNKRVSQAKLKLDLFERRLAVFERVLSFVKRLHFEPPPAEASLWAPARSAMLKDGIREIERIRPETMFLFGADVATYLDEVRRKCIVLRLDIVRDGRGTAVLADLEERDLLPEARVAFTTEKLTSHQRIEIENWFAAQALTGAHEKFAPYLDFSEWQ